MGIIESGILGAVKNKVGNVVGGKWKGRPWIRLRVNPTQNPSEASYKARDTMKAIMALARFNRESILNITFKHAVKGKKLSTTNLFVKKAITGRDVFVGYKDVPWSDGVVTPIIINSAEYNRETNLLTADVDENLQGYASATDKVIIFVSDIEDPMADIVCTTTDDTTRTNVKSKCGSGMYKILASKKGADLASGKVFMHAVCVNALGEVSTTATCKVIEDSP